MRFPPISKNDIEALLERGEYDTFALTYTLQIGRLICSVGLLEQTTVTLLALHYSHEGGWLNKHSKLKGSTFGQLVTECGKIGVSDRRLAYLKKINLLRNYVVHGLFSDFPFPGDDQISEDWLTDTIDLLERWNIHFRFAETRLSTILIRSNLLDAIPIGGDGYLLLSTQIEDEDLQLINAFFDPAK